LRPLKPHALLAGAGAYIALLWGLTPGLHWHDTAEWAGAARALALAHPPGHPLALLSTHAAQLLPWLDAAGRAAVASALWTALGAGATAELAYALMAPQELARGAQSRAASRALTLSATLAGWLYGALPLVWQQGIRAEVYAAQGALSALCLALWAKHLRTQDARPLYGAALALGLSGANHTLLAVALALPALTWCVAQRLSGTYWIGLIASCLSGLSLYAFLPLRGRAGGPVGWGWIDSWESFVDTVLARVWQAQVSARVDEVVWGENLSRLIAFLWAQVGLIGGLLACVTLTLGATQLLRAPHPARGVALTLAATCLTVALTELAYPFMTVNPDFSGYLAAGAASGVGLVALCASHLSARVALSPLSALITPALLALLLAGALSAPRPHGGPGARGAEAWARALSEEVPVGGSLWSAHYSTHFLLTGLWALEGWRGDLSPVFRGYRAQPWALARLDRPHLAPLGWRHPLSAPAPEGDPRARFEVSGPLDPLPALSRGARAVGLTWSIAPAGSPTTLSALQERWRVVASASGALDLDTCYAWALYHEAHLSWLTSGATLEVLAEPLAPLTGSPLPGAPLPRAALINAHRAARDAWLERLSAPSSLQDR
jgi:hypothetical protein